MKNVNAKATKSNPKIVAAPESGVRLVGDDLQDLWPAQDRRRKAEAPVLKVRGGDTANRLDETIGELLIKTFGDNDNRSVARSCLDSIATELSLLGTLVGDVPDVGNLGLVLYRMSLRCETAATIDLRMAVANRELPADVKALQARIEVLEAELAHAKAGAR